MKPTKMIAVAESIELEFQAATRTIRIPVGKKIARDLSNADPQHMDLDFEFEDKKLETLVIKKGDGEKEISDEDLKKQQEASSASKKKAAAKKTAAKA